MSEPEPQRPVEPYSAVDLAPTEIDDRLSAVRGEMAARGLDTLLVVGPENIYYLTGLNHQGYFSLTMVVLPVNGPPLLIARAMEHVTISTQVTACEHVPYEDGQDPAEVLVRTISDVTGVGGTVGAELEAMFFPPGVWDRTRAALPDRAWIDASRLVVEIRSVKSTTELEFIRRAARISDRAALAGMAAASSESTEREVAAAVYAQLIRAGSEHPGFAPLIRGTDILSHEHVTWRDRPLHSEAGLLMELSASVFRYHAPLTRMVSIDTVGTGTRAAAEIAVSALEAARAELRPGVLTGQVYKAWQLVVDEGLGHREYRRHHCGYMVGIGFPPSWVGGKVEGIVRDGQLVLAEGMVFHMLSWLLGQRPADYCVSDTVMVTPEGGEFLTRAPRDPSVG